MRVRGDSLTEFVCARNKQSIHAHFPGQAEEQGFSLCEAPSGRGVLGEIVGWVPPVARIEVMVKKAIKINLGVFSQSAKSLGRATKSPYFLNKCGKYGFAQKTRG